MPSAGCEITTDPARAARVLREGHVVALPTETVYGLAGDAFRAESVAAIFEAKQRPSFDPLIVHLRDASWLPRVARVDDPRVEVLAQRFWPGPLTLVLPRHPDVPDLVTSGLDSVAVRVPRHPLFREVLELTDRPLAAPSANMFGRLSPTRAEHVRQQLGGRIPLILDGGPCVVGVESTILQLVPGGALILRAGGVSYEDLASVLPRVKFAPAVLDQPLAPGQLARHYAPRTRVSLWDGQSALPTGRRVALVATAPREVPAGVDAYWLSASGSSTEAAVRLFDVLHQLDASGYDEIFALLGPESGLGRAVNDRLRRAAATFD